MKGAVLLIGSLLWEDENNSLEKKLGKVREEWRKNLSLDQKVPIKVPIRYGRRSSTRRCTYTMIFSNSIEELGSAFIIPFKKETYTGSDVDILKKQAYGLSYAEGISINILSGKLITTWGCVAIYFNQRENKDYCELKEYWKTLFNNFNNCNYKLGEEEPSITINGELNFNLEIPDSIDYVLATSLIPNISNYPDNKHIAEAILESNPRYDTYFLENVKNGIRVLNDDEIIGNLSNKKND